MEIDELQKIWKEENESLKNRVYLNEKAIKNMNLKSTSNTFKRFLIFSMVGRNLALIYFIISMVTAYYVLHEYYLSIPVVIGGLLMLWSFYHHLAIRKYKVPSNKSVVELQKSIENFRIHSMKSKYYDLLISVAWLLTLTPVFLKEQYNFDVYSGAENLVKPGLVLGGFIVFLLLISKYGYGMIDEKLKDSETRLAEVIEFEKE